MHIDNRMWCGVDAMSVMPSVAGTVNNCRKEQWTRTCLPFASERVVVIFIPDNYLGNNVDKRTEHTLYYSGSTVRG